MVEQSTYKVVKCNKDGVYSLMTEAIPKPDAGQVLIKIAYSTCNPYDAYLYYTKKEDGHTLGSDGCGTIVAVGEGVDAGLLNKKVAFFDGGWAQYKVADLNGLIFCLDDSQDLAKAASASVNPMTAIGQLDIVKKKGAKAVVVMTGASSLNKVFIKLCNKEGIEVINIVRKEEHIKMLKESYEAKHVLNSSSATFFDDLKVSFDKLKPTVFFEYVGGELPGKIFELMPVESDLVAVSALTGTPVHVNTGNVMFMRKSVKGFVVYFWLYSLS
jgi:NADPH:quinone reductase-like Zn-dependent oxidoreductase